jgi:amidase
MAKRRIRMAALSTVFMIARICFAADLSGNWIATIASPGEPQYARVSLNVEGDKVSGTWGTSKIDGTLRGNELTVTLTDDQGAPGGSLAGKLSGDTFTGTATNLRMSGRGAMAFGGGMGGRPGASGGRGGFGGGPVNFTITRAVAPPASPRDIHFEPTNFFATYSGANKAALTIFPGDVVHTWTAFAIAAVIPISAPSTSRVRFLATLWLCTC